MSGVAIPGSALGCSVSSGGRGVLEDLGVVFGVTRPTIAGLILA